MERNHEGSPRKGRVMDQSFLKAGGGRKGFCSHLSSGECCPLELSLEQGTACGDGGGMLVIAEGVRGEVTEGHGYRGSQV